MSMRWPRCNSKHCPAIYATGGKRCIKLAQVVSSTEWLALGNADKMRNRSDVMCGGGENTSYGRHSQPGNASTGMAGVLVVAAMASAPAPSPRKNPSSLSSTCSWRESSSTTTVTPALLWRSPSPSPAAAAVAIDCAASATANAAAEPCSRAQPSVSARPGNGGFNNHSGTNADAIGNPTEKPARIVTAHARQTHTAPFRHAAVKQKSYQGRRSSNTGMAWERPRGRDGENKSSAR